MLSAARAFGKAVLPPPARRTLRNCWEALRDWVDAIGLGLHFLVRRTPRPHFLLYFGFAIGDDLMCTAVLRELRKRGRDRLMMVSNHPELFATNPDVAQLHPVWDRHFPDRSTAAICRRFTRIWGGAFRRPEYPPHIGVDRRTPSSRHMIAQMCLQAGITGPVAIRPYLDLTEAEQAAAVWARDRVVIQSSGLAARHPARNKEWYPERFQAVVDAFRGELGFIQLGSSADPALDGVSDFRGATSVRASAAILSQARLYVGGEGFLMHLARAIECPSVIVFGGRLEPWQIGYACNANLYVATSCAPCWSNNVCDFDRRCMNAIQAAEVVAAIRAMLARPRTPLAVETVELPAGAA